MFKNKYIYLALLSNVFAGINVTLNKYLVQEVGTSYASYLFGYRHIIMAFILYISYKVRKKCNQMGTTEVSDNQGIDQHKSIQLSVIFHTINIGFIEVLLFRYLNNYALSIIPTNLAGVIELTEGFFVIVLYILLGHKVVGMRKSIIYYTSGVLLILVSNGLFYSSLKGVVFALLSIFLLAIADVYTKWLHQKYDADLVFVKVIHHLAGGIMLLIFNINHPASSLSLKALVVLGILILSSFALTYLYAISLEHISAYEASLSDISLTLVTTLTGVLLFSELPSIWTIISCILIYLALVVAPRE